MKHNMFFKLFTTIFVLILCSFSAFVSAQEINMLSKIIVEQPTENNSYNLSLIFNDKFEGKAFIQEKSTGSYYVFLPDTTINKDNIKIGFRNKKDKSNIDIHIEEKPIIKENSESTYVKLIINTKNNYSIKLLSKTITQEHEPASSPFNIFLFIIFGLIISGIVWIRKIIKCETENSRNKNYTSFPSNYLITNNKIENKQNITEKNHTAVLENVNIKKTLKTIDNNSFSCFNIPIEENLQQQGAMEFKSTLKQTSSIFKDKAIKSKHTNPIKKSYNEDSSELKLPLVNEVTKTKNENKEEKSPELLSELHITPTKGFYLTESDNTFALFGFVGDKVYLLKRFTDLSQINLQARFYDNNGNNDMYIVRLDSYKAMIEISDSGMKELAVL